MPIYEFHCQKCSTLFEVLVTSTDPKGVTCKECGSGEVKKVLSAAAYRLSSGGGKAISNPPLSGCGSRSGFS